MGTRDDEYAAFVRARSHALLRSAFLLTGDQHLAEDLVQEALARTHRAWSRLRETHNAEAYTRRTMYHLQVSWWRRRRVAEELPGDLPESTDQLGRTDAESITRRITVERALRSLSPKQRAVVVLRYFDDHTEAEAAEMLGVSVSTVKTQTVRALERLRKLVPELGELRATEGAGK
ncbi:SigE family RNA polymerase sigma factor [Plantactinospora sp. BB1]|uniref:SigE family RNA polymerase sigma factor n=1 Tax=Plantactinospora sp. BB1 TaxID=2071627 RepID=UPI000D165A7F|nr:SigE family RNA polymerase sigma factor [Plantactinospora sp. BB1]AVT41023.1 SigE family RNA polymerase sigma factor [Plantactinospora sp. BB1]